MQARPRLHQVARRAEEVRRPGEVWTGIRRILIARNGPLGPLVLALPAIAALRSTYPSAWLAVLVRSANAPFARLVSGVDQVIEDSGDPNLLPPMLKAFRADLFISMSSGGRVSWAAATARVRHRVGPGRRVYSALFERRVDERTVLSDRHEVESALSYAHRAGAAGGPARFPLAIPVAAGESASVWLEEHGIGRRFVVLRPESVTASCPPWPPGHFVRLATLLAAEGIEVVFSTSPGDDPTARLLDAAELPARRMPRFTGDLATLSALVRTASLVVGNGTGPLHLAAVSGTPTIFLQAPWPSCGPARFGPYAANGWSLVPELPEAAEWNARERAARGRDLMASISPAVALSCALAILDGRTPSL
ncbi:MAG: glycosyltransferase family 9 protein [Acidobacteriia bacterium]|nr:glycosyltransferase family 9 protein [Terriglobia bacterium]